MNDEEAKLKFTRADWQLLAQSTLVTREVEIGCDECLDHVAAYAEAHLTGLPVHGALSLVEEHLAICEECREEFEALLEALRAVEDPRKPE